MLHNILIEKYKLDMCIVFIKINDKVWLKQFKKYIE